MHKLFRLCCYIWKLFSRFAVMNRRILTYGGYFERFIESLSYKEKQKVKYGLLLLKTLDKMPTKFVKYIRGGIYELRTEYNGNIFRVFFTNFHVPF